jgi:hypothetical protein
MNLTVAECGCKAWLVGLVETANLNDAPLPQPYYMIQVSLFTYSAT